MAANGSKVYTFTASRQIDGEFYCNCQPPRPCVKRLSVERSRHFYSCTRDHDDPGRCKFFRWDEQCDIETPTTVHSPATTVISRSVTPPPSTPTEPRSNPRPFVQSHMQSAPSTPKRPPRYDPESAARRKALISQALGESPQPSFMALRTPNSMDVDSDSTSTVKPSTGDKGKGRADIVVDDAGSPKKKFRPASKARKGGTPGGILGDLDDPDNPFRDRGPIKPNAPIAVVAAPPSEPHPSQITHFFPRKDKTPPTPAQARSVPQPEPAAESSRTLKSILVDGPKSPKSSNVLPAETKTSNDVIASLEFAVQYIRDLEQRLKDAEARAARVAELETELERLRNEARVAAEQKAESEQKIKELEAQLKEIRDSLDPTSME
ncbi:hypothetical protein FRC03_003437 [Tulasnella sp. 419]|nr:hypothetical protein FRC03_003437 [Tulasnella sp. 419]